MTRRNTKFEVSTEECPQCGSLLDHARHVREARSMAVGARVGWDEVEELDDWMECLDCGHLSTDLEDLPPRARREWLEVWG